MTVWAISHLGSWPAKDVSALNPCSFAERVGFEDGAAPKEGRHVRQIKVQGFGLTEKPYFVCVRLDRLPNRKP